MKEQQEIELRTKILDIIRLAINEKTKVELLLTLILQKDEGQI